MSSLYTANIYDCICFNLQSIFNVQHIASGLIAVAMKLSLLCNYANKIFLSLLLLHGLNMLFYDKMSRCISRFLNIAWLGIWPNSLEVYFGDVRKSGKIGVIVRRNFWLIPKIAILYSNLELNFSGVFSTCKKYF